MRGADLLHMTFAPPIEAMTLAEVRAEMEALIAKKNSRGGFHPSEYWRMKDLAKVEETLLGLSPQG